MCIFASAQVMIATTKGIVLHHIRYTDSSVIAKIYTERFGLQSYLVRGVGQGKRNKKAGLMQPLSLVELTARQKEDGGLSTVRDIRMYSPYQELQSNVIKCTVALFIAEVLYKTLQEDTASPSLYTYLEGALQLLDLEKHEPNFHLWFLMRYSRHLGFEPSAPEEEGMQFFDLREGRFTLTPPLHPDYAEKPETKAVLTLLGTNFDAIGGCIASASVRKSTLEVILRYFRFHLEGMREIQSHKVLQTVLND